MVHRLDFVTRYALDHERPRRFPIGTFARAVLTGILWAVTIIIVTVTVARAGPVSAQDQDTDWYVRVTLDDGSKLWYTPIVFETKVDCEGWLQDNGARLAESAKALAPLKVVGSECSAPNAQAMGLLPFVFQGRAFGARW